MVLTRSGTAPGVKPPADARLAFLTQTTLSVDEAKVVIDALRKKYPRVVGPNKDDICYATQNRQEAVKDLVPEADVVLVLGSQNSSNSQRLAEIARATGRPAHLIDRASELRDDWFKTTDGVAVSVTATVAGWLTSALPPVVLAALVVNWKLSESVYCPVAWLSVKPVAVLLGT